jgi:hypothetical protein
MKKLIAILLILLAGCSSVDLVENWKNPDIVLFDAYKVLIVGMTQNMGARDDFESNLHKEFKKRGVESMRSIDLFDVDFTNAQQSEEELDAVEQQLLDKDFDAILFTKITGYEDREIFRKKLADWTNYNDTFHDDYFRHQPIYYDESYYDSFTVYHAETSLYCICVGKERELIWRGSIDITDPQDISKSIDDYIKLVVLALEEQDLIFHKEKNNEVTGL